MYYVELFNQTEKDTLYSCLDSIDENETDEADVVPLVAAIQLDDFELVKYMLSHGFSARSKSFLSSPVGAAISSDKPNGDRILTLLLEEIGRIEEEHPMDYCGELNEPMLHAAVRRKKIATIELLLEYGASPLWYDNDNQCALDVAKDMGDDIVIGLLRKKQSNQR